MTRLTYRGNRYYKEQAAETGRRWWNRVHAPSMWLQYRGLKYRPIQMGGLIEAESK